MTTQQHVAAATSPDPHQQAIALRYWAQSSLALGRLDRFQFLCEVYRLDRHPAYPRTLADLTQALAN
ncbi:MAG: hypothetical protein AAFY15_05660 [Cyanobacteria bacterium J06648_11]